MYRYNILLTVFLLFLTSHTIAQNRKVVEYDFQTGEYNGVLPFDQAFDFKLKNIADTVQTLYVRIYEIKKLKYREVYEQINANRQNRVTPATSAGKNTLTTRDILTASGGIVFQTDKLVRGVNFTGQSAVTTVAAYLKPNSRYFVEINGSIRQAITNEDEMKIAEIVANNDDLITGFNNLADSLIQHSSGSSQHISPLSELINKIANEEAKAINPQYKVVYADYSPVLNSLGAAFGQIRNISDGFNAAKHNAYKEAQNEIKNKKVPALKKEYESAVNAEKKVPENATAEIKKAAADNKKLISNQLEFYSAFTTIEIPENGPLPENVVTKLENIDWTRITKDEALIEISNIIDTDFKDSAPSMINQVVAPLFEKRAAELKTSIQENIEGFVTARDKALKDVQLSVKDNIITTGQTISTYPEGLQEKFKIHATIDLGYAYVGGIDRMNLYTGMNIYFRGIDTALPLKNYRTDAWDFIGARTSLLLGISLQSIKKTDVRRGLINDDMALVTGLGFRLLPWFKINGGTYLYYRYPRNPLSSKDRMSVAGSPFVSLSIDFNVGSFLSSFGNGKIAQIFTQ